MTTKQLQAFVLQELAHLPNKQALSKLVVAHLLQTNLTQSELDKPVSLKQFKQAQKLAKKLANGKPFAYVTRQTEFFGLRLTVNKHTLIPRQETELLVEQVVACANQQKAERVLDLCTGSGAIGLSVAKHTKAQVMLADISKQALRVAKQNAKQNHINNVLFVQSDLFEDITNKFDMIVSNPPYIKTKELQTLEPSVKDWEPMLALDGKQDGLYFYKQIAKLAPKHLKEGGVLWLEVGAGQAQQVAELLQTDFCDIVIRKDYAQIDRMISARKKTKETK